MKSLGIDPSSTSTGIALVDDFKLLSVHLWKPRNKEISSNLRKYHEKLISSRFSSHIDSVCVERVSVTLNMNAVRRIAYMEAMSLLAAEELGCKTIYHVNPTHARKVVFGKGNIKKDEVYELITSRFNTISFLPFKSGGADQSDATVLALSMQIEEKEVAPIFTTC